MEAVETDSKKIEMEMDTKKIAFWQCMGCGKTFDSEMQKIQHLRHKACKQTLVMTNNTCVMCLRSFSSYAGIRQHQRRAHPKEFIQSVLEKKSVLQSKRRWSFDEDQYLASIEASLFTLNTTIILNYLVTKSNRSRNAIKKRRQQPTYISLVTRLRQQNNLQLKTNDNVQLVYNSDLDSTDNDLHLDSHQSHDDSSNDYKNEIILNKNSDDDSDHDTLFSF